MPKKKPENGQTQRTKPAEGKPVTIPVPKRDDVLGALRKVAKPKGDGRKR
jgi:hypothetical protein